MSISAEEKNRYLRETAIVLAREGFHTDRTHTGGLRVLLDGAPLCEVTENGGITYRNEDIDEPERIDAKDKVYEIVRTTAEYMRQMETAPFLKADGLEDGYKVLADFNGIVLAGIQSKYGAQFVTWDWSFDRKGVCHGHYYTGLYSSGNYDAVKRDFAVRSGLIPKQQLFREEQLIEIYQNQIMAELVKNRMPEETERGLMHWYHEADSVNTKVHSAVFTVEERDRKLWGVAECRIAGELSAAELDALKAYITGQASDGWGEHFEQQEILVDGGSELYVHLWNADDWGIQTEQERFAPKLAEGLPELCFSVLPSTGELICIKRGENGYYPSDWSTDDSAQNRELADYNNERLGVTQAQRLAMECGSMHGWDNSPTLDEAPLQQAILAALNTAMADKNSLIRQITDAMETEIIPFPGGTMSLGDIERRLRELEQQFQTLLEKATDDPAAYGGQFKEILDEQTFLKEKRSGILSDNNEQAKANQRIMDAAQTLENASLHITEWDESAVRQLVETVKVLSKDEIAVTLKGGIEICQKIMY